MTKENRINAFIELGEFLSEFVNDRVENSHLLETEIKRNHLFNPWFTIDNIRQAIKSITYFLNDDSLRDWTSEIPEIDSPKSVAVIMAGNIPLVGFHDFLSVLISGHSIKIKLSKDDNKLLPIIVDQLINIEPRFKNMISFSERNLKDFDAIIATGSNNSNTYFNDYFSSYPNIFRANRTSVAILDGSETIAQRKGLANDIFSYFGLGCRSVTKIYVPKGYDLDLLFNVFYDFKDVMLNNKYTNNYDYNKAVYMMGKHSIIENGFLILKQDKGLHAPVSVLFYEYYNDRLELQKQLDKLKNQIQCVCGKGFLPFGLTQKPSLTDYADGVDTLSFLSKL